MKFKFLVLLFFLGAQLGSAQIDFSGSANFEVYYSNKEELPFWFYSGRRGRISEYSNLTTWMNSKASYDFSEDAKLELGGGLFYTDGGSNNISIDELYAQFDLNWLRVTAGSKQEDEVLNGLSASNNNILWSLNSGPIPGIKFETLRPIYISSEENLGLKFYWAESYLGDNPGASNVRLHHKQIQLSYKFNTSWQLKVGLRHFVQWGGFSEKFGGQPQGFSDYLKVISGRGGGENSVESEQANALGNHLGSWHFDVLKIYNDFCFNFIFNNLFEDGSGSRFANYPDGRYALFFKLKDSNKLINSILYEFYYTKKQSQTGPHLYDNYFSNGVYPFGWTYKERVIGVPFFTYDAELNKIVNNKFIAHHLGITGEIFGYSRAFPYKILLSYAHNEGTYAKPLNQTSNEDVFYFFSSLRILNSPLAIAIKTGMELNTLKEPVFSGGISISRNF